jgi:hypothetical protein
MKFSLAHATYNILTCLRSLKFSYINSLYKRPYYLIQKIYSFEKSTLINIILKLNNKRYHKLKIEYILTNYASNKQLKIEYLLSKYLQSYKYFLRKQNNFYFNVSTNINQKTTSPLHLTGLQSLYITYKILQSKHPIYIYHKINRIS